MKQSNQFVVMFLLPVLMVAVYMTTYLFLLLVKTETLKLKNITIDELTPLGKCCQTRDVVNIHINAQTDSSDFSLSTQALGLQSFWCRPILSAESRTVLGTFCLFHRERFTPLPDDIDVINALSKTAAIIIERNNENRARRVAESALLENIESFNKQRRLYETALSNTPDLLYIFDLEGILRMPTTRYCKCGG